MWQTLSRYRLQYTAAVLLLGFGALFSYVPPLIIRATVDSVLGQEPFSANPLVGSLFAALGRNTIRNNLWFPGLLIISASLLRGAAVFPSRYFAARAAEEGARDLRNRLFAHLNRLPAAYHAAAEKGDLLKRCTSDVETVRKFLARQLVQVGNALFLVTVSLIVTFSIHVPLALVTLPIIPLAVTASVLFFGKIQTSFRASDEAEAALTTMVQEHISGIRVVRAFGREAGEYARFQGLNGEYRTVTMKLVRAFSTYWSLTDILSFLQILAVV